MFCYKCGKEVDEDQIFCPFCGTRLRQDEDEVSSGQKERETIPAKKGNSRTPIIIVAIVAALAVIGVAVFLFLGNDASDKNTEASQPSEEMTEAITEAEVNNNIPADAVEFDGHFYEVVNDGMSWTDAKAACEERGGHLVIITSQDEESFIEDLIEDNRDGDIYHYWLGATDEEEEGIWKWVDGEVFWQGTLASQGGHSVEGMYQNWLPSQPNNSVKEGEVGQDYLEIQVTRGNEGASEYMTWTDITNNGVAYGFEGPEDYNDTQYYGHICEWEE